VFKDASLAFWVYILQCSDGRYYTGQTDNLDYRFAQAEAKRPSTSLRTNEEGWRL